jgi:hypothetical protein
MGDTKKCFEKGITQGRGQEGRAGAARSSISGIVIRKGENTHHSAEEPFGDRMD